jgi:hypothetical protein
MQEVIPPEQIFLYEHNIFPGFHPKKEFHMTLDYVCNKDIFNTLPASVQDLVKLIGMEDTRKLLSLYGGMRKYIPSGRSQNTNLENILSRPSFEAICREYGGDTIELPKVDSLVRAERDLEIFLQSSRGVSRKDLSKAYGLTIRHIGNIRSRFNKAVPLDKSSV